MMVYHTHTNTIGSITNLARFLLHVRKLSSSFLANSSDVVSLSQAGLYIDTVHTTLTNLQTEISRGTVGLEERKQVTPHEF